MIKIDLKFDLKKSKERKIHLVFFQGLLRKCFCDFAYLNVCGNDFSKLNAN